MSRKIRREGAGSRWPSRFASAPTPDVARPNSELVVEVGSLPAMMNASAIKATAKNLGIKTAGKSLTELLREVTDRRVATEGGATLLMQEEAAKLKGTSVEKARSMLEAGVAPEQAVLASVRAVSNI